MMEFDPAQVAPSEFGRHVVNYRQTEGIARDKLAELLGMREVVLARVEAGQRRINRGQFEHILERISIHVVEREER